MRTRNHQQIRALASFCMRQRTIAIEVDGPCSNSINCATFFDGSAWLRRKEACWSTHRHRVTVRMIRVSVPTGAGLNSSTSKWSVSRITSGRFGATRAGRRTTDEVSVRSVLGIGRARCRRRPEGYPHPTSGANAVRPGLYLQWPLFGGPPSSGPLLSQRFHPPHQGRSGHTACRPEGNQSACPSLRYCPWFSPKPEPSRG